MSSRPDRARTDQSRIGLAEAARELRIPYQQAHRLLLLGVLPGFKRGGRWLVSAAAVRRLGRPGLIRALTHVHIPEGADEAE